MKFRLLQTGYNSAAHNMALDEAALEHIANGSSPPTLRFYGWSPPAISIGYFQSLEEEVDLAACKKYNIDFVRRITGGGAVFHEHEITYSIHIPEKIAGELALPMGILESYGKICGGILKGLVLLGLNAQFVPLNDIIIIQNGTPKKISGNAQTRKKGIILQHGTILLKVDVDKMFELLKVPDEKLKGKLIENVKQRVTGLSQALGREIDFEEALAALKKGFSEEFSVAEFELGELKESEKTLLEKLKMEKYGADEWNKRR
ncbi:lipoate--protein ligase family protein [Candidatus Peregrinibacteria bacterium]|nr:lipoate--protein ligase family protein [Candidatus Peregrinibacteria bacterium]